MMRFLDGECWVESRLNVLYISLRSTLTLPIPCSTLDLRQRCLSPCTCLALSAKESTPWTAREKQSVASTFANGSAKGCLGIDRLILGGTVQLAATESSWPGVK